MLRRVVDRELARSRADELVAIRRELGEEVDYFIAPAREQRGPVGVTLRAEVADLQLSEFSAAINAFVDEIEDAPLPPARVTVKAIKPEAAAKEDSDEAQRAPTTISSTTRWFGRRGSWLRLGARPGSKPVRR